VENFVMFYGNRYTIYRDLNERTLVFKKELKKGNKK
jgi:hypothetical protein